jgi:hypothetical protein
MLGSSYRREIGKTMSEETKNTTNESVDEAETLKERVRETIGDLVGEAVKVGDVLGGIPGDIAKLSGDAASVETEEFLDRIDGKG